MPIKNTFFLILFLNTLAVGSAQKVREQIGKAVPPAKSIVGSAAVSVAERIILDLILQNILKGRNEKNNTLFGSNDIGYNKIDTISLVNKINNGRRINKSADAQLSSFFVEGIARANNILWSTNAEKNVGGYMIERSSNDHTFIAIGSIDAKNTRTLQQYSFTDVKIKDTILYQYRIKIIGKNGESQLFIPIIKDKPILGVSYKLDTVAKLLYINSPIALKKMEVMNTDGKILITQKKINLLKPLETNTLLPGVYTIKVYTDNNIVSQLFFKIN